MLGAKYGNHIDAPKQGMFFGSDAQKKLSERSFDSLFFGKRVDGLD